jgi:membrane protease subunit HflC
MNRLFSLAILTLVVTWLLFSSIFLVDQRQYAVLSSFSGIKHAVKRPGLHLKLPFPLQKIIFLDNRISNIDLENPDIFLTLEKKNILVDTSVEWKINDPKLYLTKSASDRRGTQDKIIQITEDSLRNEIKKRTVQEVISGVKGKVSDSVNSRIEEKLQKIGIRIVGLNLKHINYVEKDKSSVFNRMKSEQLQITNKLRATGHADSERIRENADKECTSILAKAHRDAKRVRGDGDAKASRIYANAFSLDLEFYKFYRSLEIYRTAFKNRQDLIIIDPNPEFFKYFRSPEKK